MITPLEGTQDKHGHTSASILSDFSTDIKIYTSISRTVQWWFRAQILDSEAWVQILS